MSDNKIIDLYRKGLSRKIIAKNLGISEWKVRCAIRQQHTKTIKAKEFKTQDDIRLDKVSISKNNTLKKAIVLSDIHVPYHDQAALSVALAYTKEYCPDIIILNGDIIDFYGASSYRQDPIRIDTLQDELTEGKALLKKIRAEHPNAEIFYIEGNHETRLKRFLLDKAPALACLSCLSFDELVGLKEFDIKFIDYGQSIQLGDLEVTHGEIVRKGAGMSAKAHADKSGASILIGHTHRVGVICRTNKWGTHVAIENGHLGRNDFEYVNNPDWQHGFTQVEYFDDGRFFTRSHIINNGSLVVDGVTYEAV